ncbi:hypothetical protein C0995_016194 [Termitomyces sp. Mi166|nr:hypothetical protein C0995_016194 [Termitomyces sp. Mi166\
MSKLDSIRSRLHRLIGWTDVDQSHVDAPMRARRRHRVLGYAVRKSRYIFLVCVFVLFLRAGLLAGDNEDGRQSYEDVRALSFSSPREDHPITKLMDEGEEKYRVKLEGQSKTLKEAVEEYRRRYKRGPPRGFDKWWEFARKNNVKFVDEYDGLVGDLEPFWEMSGEELRRRVGQVGQLPSIDLVRIKNGEASTLRMNAFEDSEVSARANGFAAMISQFAPSLPDMDFSINAKAEGRVLVPWEHRKYPNLTRTDSSVGIETMLDGPFRPDWGTDGNVWEAWRRTCAPTSTARRLFSSLRNVFVSQLQSYIPSDAPPGPDFGFASTTAAHSLDFCSAPHTHYTQGHFFSDWRTLPVLYPVFSPARAQGFMDIRIPSHYYYGSTARYTYGWDPVNLELGDTDKMEVPWNEKHDQMFWRGATTGGGSHPPGFAPQYQRHRFLRMTSDTSSTPRLLTFPLPPSPSPSPSPSLSLSSSSPSAPAPPPPKYTTSPLPLSTLNTIMNTAFTKAVSPASYPGGLPALQSTHRFSDAVPLGEHWKYKYLVDIDGMGYSARFMAFLASGSVPLKATVYQEFFEGWIQPWVHYIPLSDTYSEIYNIYAYFSGLPRAAIDVLGGDLDLNLTAEAEAEAEGQQVNHDAWSRPVDGDRRLRRIARAGREWKMSVGRAVDMEGRCPSFSLSSFVLYSRTRTHPDSVRIQTRARVGETLGG